MASQCSQHSSAKSKNNAGSDPGETLFCTHVENGNGIDVYDWTLLTVCTILQLLAYPYFLQTQSLHGTVSICALVNKVSKYLRTRTCSCMSWPDLLRPIDGKSQ